MHLEVTNCDSQHRRRDIERSGAAQHVSQDGLTLGALARLEVASHRGAVVTAALGQHRPALISVLSARSITRSCRHRLAFGEQFEHQALAILGAHDFADRAAHQAIHAGERGDHYELFPHVEEDVVARRRIDPRRCKGLCDPSHPVADAAGALAEGNAVYPVEMTDDPVRGESCADIGYAAEHALRDPASIEITSFALGEDLDRVKRLKEMGVARVVPMFPPDKADKVLPIVDRWAKVMNQING